MFKARKHRLGLVAGVAATLFAASNALAWGWWYVGSIVVGAAVCVATGGIGVPVVAGLAVGSVGTAAVGDSVYDDIVASPTNPAPLSEIHQQASLGPIPMPPVVDQNSPPQIMHELNQTRQGLADALQLSRGVRESCRRFYGARLVGDAGAMQFQASNALQFLQQHEAQLQIALSHFAQYSAMMRPMLPRNPQTMATAAEYRAFVGGVRSQGLPPCIETELVQLQLTSIERTNIRTWIASKTDTEIASFFAPFGPAGAYAPDLWDEMIRQFNARTMRQAVPAEIQAFWAPRCVADVDDGSGTGTPDGGVTVDDLIYYLSLFESGDARADVDDGSGNGTPDGGVTIEDLLYYLFRFEYGC